MGDRNRERQDLVKEAVTEAKAMVQKMGEVPNIITLVSDHWNEGIIGLIASKITEENYRPTIVMTKSDGFLKASARSIPTFHITNFLRELKEKYLVDVGGHSGAAGFTIESNKLNGFLEEVQKRAKKLFTPQDLEKIIEVDIKLPVSTVTLNLVTNLEKLQPFGVGNPQPTFYSEVVLLETKLFGKKNEHLRLYVKDPEENMYPLELVAFGKGEIYSRLSPGMKMNIVYTAEINRWGGIEKVQGRLLNIL
jgi:single-stranded-DNA-specific exonuclease